MGYRILVAVLCAAAAGGVVSGCASSSSAAETAAAATPGSQAALQSGDWKVFEIAGAPVQVADKTIVGFSDGRVAGNGGCNHFTGTYELASEGVLKMGQVAATMRACIGPEMEQEHTFLKILGTVNGFSVADGVLTLTSADGRSIRAKH